MVMRVIEEWAYQQFIMEQKCSFLTTTRFFVRTAIPKMCADVTTGVKGMTFDVRHPRRHRVKLIGVISPIRTRAAGSMGAAMLLIVR